MIHALLSYIQLASLLLFIVIDQDELHADFAKEVNRNTFSSQSNATHRRPRVVHRRFQDLCFLIKDWNLPEQISINTANVAKPTLVQVIYMIVTFRQIKITAFYVNHVPTIQKCLAIQKTTPFKASGPVEWCGSVLACFHQNGSKANPKSMPYRTTLTMPGLAVKWSQISNLLS